MYAYLDANGWHLQKVEGDLRSVVATSLVLDENGYAHISYSSDGLYYAYQDAGSWQSEEVDTLDLNIRYISLAVDGVGNPHISYEVGSTFEAGWTDKLMYAVRQTEGWDVQAAVTRFAGDMSWVRPISLILDVNNLPHIGYTRRYYYNMRMDLSELGYAFLGAAGWQDEVVHGELSLDTDTFSMALDINGSPHFSYPAFSYPAGGGLKYTYLSAGEWISTTLAQGFMETPQSFFMRTVIHMSATLNISRKAQERLTT